MPAPLLTVNASLLFTSVSLVNILGSTILNEHTDENSIQLNTGHLGCKNSLQELILLAWLDVVD